ncbi:nuclease-related domain-containing protein [Clostridium sp. AL.422]|uniref:nuclease-related domain-containing protein n=1 Tax=Clostridium TaxID=1485 RepID=UPI00293DBBB5|nr:MULTISPECIES: nuclease-related domain-containing protein [unclassified Clostridium]MDV4152611.1 nuclease-related domain-containing protein [Clostridium sp. AL.422]
MLGKMVVIVALILILLIITKRRNVNKLNIGEQEVNNLLSKIKGYKLLTDIMIKGERGTTQIDHILIGKKGIFVIETKDYSGLIYGEEYSRYWTQIINRNSNQFYNPIRQNYGHVKSLERYIKRNDIFISLIVFTNKSKLKKVKTETPVIQLNKLKRFIKRYKSDIRLSKKEIDEIYNHIKKSNIESSRERKKHVKRIIKNIS